MDVKVPIIPGVRSAIFAATSLIVLAGFSSAATATAWYLDGLNGGRHNTGTQASPFLYLWQALQVVQPGDTIYVVNSMTYPFLGFSANGTAAAPITLSGGLDPANLTHVSGGGVNQSIWINGNYLVVQGFDLTSPGAYPGIGTAPNMHHITIASNVIHDSGQNGINTFANDYLTISHNIVYGNAKNTSKGFGSGISILGSVDIDTNTGVKMIIDGNIVYENTNTPNCSTPSCYATALDSDGSGIILDTNQRERWDNIPYKGAFLISNNVIYKNGGRGVHVYLSDNATITGNTMWENNQDPYGGNYHPGEVEVRQGGNTAVYNNILYSDGLDTPYHTGTTPNYHVSVSFENCTDGVGPLIAKYNIGYNPPKISSQFSYIQNNTNPVTIGSNMFASPKFESTTNADFRFKPGSPAYETGNARTSVATDILGVSRLPLPSMGAYQNPGP